jgi:hypothetical protein
MLSESSLMLDFSNVEDKYYLEFENLEKIIENEKINVEKN